MWMKNEENKIDEEQMFNKLAQTGWMVYGWDHFDLYLNF